MNTLHKVAVLLAGLLALAACRNPPAEAPTPAVPAQIGAQSSPDSMASSMPTAASFAADIAAIRTAGAAKDHAYTTGNADVVAAVYDDDAVLMPQSERTAKGQAAIRRFLRDYVARLARGGYTLIFASAVEIGVSGNLGFRSGTYLINDKTGAQTDFGKWLEVWRKSGDTWRISRDIWNSDTLPLMLTDEPEDTGEPTM